MQYKVLIFNKILTNESIFFFIILAEIKHVI
jgi:hypothetical protein